MPRIRDGQYLTERDVRAANRNEEAIVRAMRDLGVQEGTLTPPREPKVRRPFIEARKSKMSYRCKLERFLRFVNTSGGGKIERTFNGRWLRTKSNFGAPGSSKVISCVYSLKAMSARCMLGNNLTAEVKERYVRELGQKLGLNATLRDAVWFADQEQAVLAAAASGRQLAGHASMITPDDVEYA